jgi:hypothetical protein
MNNIEYSRRGFIKGGTVAAAGVLGAIALTGCSDNAASASDASTKTEDWMPESWDYETDILVIGYGGAGMWTALTSKDECASDVLILEKAPYRGGGNSSYNFGEFQVPTDENGAVEYILAASRDLTSESMARAWAKEAMRNTEYADKYNYPWYQEPDHKSASGSVCEYPFLPGGDTMGVAKCEGLGMAAFEVLDKARADLGIEIVFDCHDEELIQNPETNEILGCWTLIGNDTTPKAVKGRKGTVICTGGFEFNEEMKNNYLKCTPQKFYGWQYNTGDGIGMVGKVGAQLWHMDLAIGGGWMAPANNDPNFPFNLPMASIKDANFVDVNKQGNRWHAETDFPNPHNGWHAWLPFNESIADFDHIPSWTIFDKTAFDAGPIGPRSTDPMAHGNYAPGFPKDLGGWDDWSEDNVTELNKGWILQADTIEALGNEIKKYEKWMDVDNLIAAVERYNQLAEAGDDTDFHRNSVRMAPVVTPPFYAIATYPGGCSTLGGAKRNENAQVLDWDDKPIPRLYSAGSFGNFIGHTYGITGGNVAENMVFGRLAARHASNLDAWDSNGA